VALLLHASPEAAVARARAAKSFGSPYENYMDSLGKRGMGIAYAADGDISRTIPLILDRDLIQTHLPTHFGQIRNQSQNCSLFILGDGEGLNT